LLVVGFAQFDGFHGGRTSAMEYEQASELTSGCKNF